MLDPIADSDELHLVERCLDGDTTALRYVQENHREWVLKFLLRSGANPQEAEEIVDSLWADCLAGDREHPPRLRQFDGRCALRSWLNKIALNHWITRKRKEQRWAKLVGSFSTENFDEDQLSAPEISESRIRHDDSVVALMLAAVEYAFAQCPAEDFVMLQLEHYDGLTQSELARMFGCSKATICRAVERAKSGIVQSTVEFIKRADPWLDLQWDDFVEICRISRPAFLGPE